MITIRKAAERGHQDHGWLNSYHTFSFAHYYDRAHMGFSHLRVINDDIIAGGKGFDFHPHRDMEILTYIISGEIHHQDSMGNSSIIKRFEIQKMTAGTGVLHSEYNNLKNENTHLLQIWVLPNKAGHHPSYEQKSFEDKIQNSNLILLASNDQKGLVNINQDIKIFAGINAKDFQQEYQTNVNRKIYIHNIAGNLHLENEILGPGDGAKIEQLASIKLFSHKATEFLLFDIA